jgi:hypothetical protein
VASNPAFLATVLTACITVAITWSSDRQATHQRETDNLRYEQDTRKSILLGIINPGDPYSIAAKLKLFLDTGLIADSDGKFRQTQEQLTNQIQQEILDSIVRASNDIPIQFGSASAAPGKVMAALLQPIDLETLDFLIRQGYPREMLFWLFVDSFQVTLPGGETFGYHYNPPGDYGCSRVDIKHRCFIDWVQSSVLMGLWV